MKNIIEALKWRYATKKFDIDKKIDGETFEGLLDALRLSPSSYGLQPWKFIIVKNKEMREKIREAAYGQSQTTDASHLLVFANKKNIDDNLIDEYINFVAKEKNIDISNLDGFSKMMKGSFKGRTMEDLRGWASCQLYLAAGNLLTVCAISGIDACPMEGFDKAKLDELLGLSSLDLESKMIIVLGYRSVDDMDAAGKKIRFAKEDVFIEIN